MSVVLGRESPSSFGTARELLKTPSNEPIRYTGSTSASLADTGRLVLMDAAGANSYTISADTGMPFPNYTTLTVCQLGAGATTIVAGAGVTIRAFDGGLVFAGRYATASLFKLGANEWLAFGGLTA